MRLGALLPVAFLIFRVLLEILYRIEGDWGNCHEAEHDEPQSALPLMRPDQAREPDDPRLRAQAVLLRGLRGASPVADRDHP
jgi:hypothetical protein